MRTFERRPQTTSPVLTGGPRTRSGGRSAHARRDESSEAGAVRGNRARPAGHRFGRYSVSPPGAAPATGRAGGAVASRNPGGSVPEGEVVTAGPHPAPAPGVFPPTPAPPPLPTGQCHVKLGPAYVPAGSVPVSDDGTRKSARFAMAATFDTAYVTVPPRKPSCCEVRQYIRWDEAFHRWRGGPPHSGFPSSASANTWYEDRDTRDKRYGHRSGPHSDPIAGCWDEYLTAGTRDQANGDVYCGGDRPGGPSAMTGRFEFRLDVVDTCGGNAVKATSPVISIDW